MAIWRLSASGQWRGDLAALRDVGLVAVSWGGGISLAATQLLLWLPLGSVAFRAGLVSALALLIAAAVLYRLIERALSLATTGMTLAPSITPLLSMIGTLVIALSPAWQREATVAGGAMVATMLALLAMHGLFALCDPRASSTMHRARPVVGILAIVGMLFAEAPMVGLAATAAVVGVLLSRSAFRRRRLRTVVAPRRVLGPGLAFALVAFLFFAIPSLVRPLSPSAVINLGPVVGGGESLVALDAAASRITAAEAWLRQLGPLALLLSGLGLVLSSVTARTRFVAAAAVVWLAADVLFPARHDALLSSDPYAGIRLGAISLLALLSVVGVARLIALLLSLQLPMARAGAVLLVVFYGTVVALTSEEANFEADRSEQFGAEEWTDLALGNVASSSVILVREPSMMWRLWAEQVTRGARPDVLIVPEAALGRGKVAHSLVARERALEHLLRAYALTGGPDEFALSHVADRRHLYVEYDPRWDDRIANHLVVHGAWLHYAPQPLGASDRAEAIDDERAPGEVRRVLSSIDPVISADRSTKLVAVAMIRNHAVLLSRLGDREASAEFMAQLAELNPEDPLDLRSALYFAVSGLDVHYAVSEAKTTSEEKRREDRPKRAQR